MTFARPHPRRRAAIAAAALCLPLLTHGADKILPLGDGPATGKTLTKSQLSECLQMQPRLSRESEAALRGKAELDATKAEFDRLEAQLQGERDKVNASDKASVDAYNAKVDRRAQLLADYQARQPAFNDQALSYNALQQTWKRDCEDRPYREDDYAELQRDK